MDTNIIIALIGLLSSVLVQFGGILINSKLTNYRIEQLEKEVQKHNNLVERVYKLEQDTAVQGEKMPIYSITGGNGADVPLFSEIEVDGTQYFVIGNNYCVKM